MGDLPQNEKLDEQDLVLKSALLHLKQSGLNYFHLPSNPPEVAVSSVPEALDKTSIEVESAKVSSPINGFCAICQRQQGTANEIVVTAGKMDSPDILFIGEAPSEEDGNNFKPFEDPAGKFLAGAITKGLKLKVKEVGLCNIYKCESITKGSKSDDDEKTTCRDFLHQQIEKINPKVIICLGGTAQMAISGVDRGITKIRGQWQTWKDIPVMPTIHPNYILHNPSAKRDFWEDLKKVMERLGMS